MPKTNESVSAIVLSKVGYARKRQTNTSDQLFCCNISPCKPAKSRPAKQADIN